MNLDNAIKLATEAHAGQVDKGGQPYILHPLRVMLAMAITDERIVAVLHDVVEDTDVSCDDLYWVHGFKPDIVTAIAALTRRNGEDYFDFIRRVAANSIAQAVKIADLRDNLDPSRPLPDDANSRARAQKYRRALSMLMKVRE
ncbi:HD domain-containing protein [Rhizobium giardinii]|jgi:(p)ppGpp synthase/HD superfamily hydrolase|uniref:(P)ppGpp synthase/HD superfamily hydrolase n=1 Tax=Rhizobium giardinii TaxID=56731 RepID=A0A7W8UCP4_9HYPH|nr:HD domain-containing protein [Rhizobium giardinii]MBB5536936.1 (p)ppGpp synthase/HD superfamily hydrolase [Rhizobium giardinii]